jgi:hypothetical protein
MLTPARYFPLEKGVYEVAPGLRSLGQSMGNGERDGQVFQLDSEFPVYRENKTRCRAERLSKYYTTSEYSAATSTAVNRFIVHRLVAEHPTRFEWKSGTLHCRLTGDQIALDENYELKGPSPYSTAFDALACQVQEDIAVLCAADDRRDWLAALHLCSPSHWAAEDKIGKNFVDVHKPIPGIEKINRAASSFVDAMINKGPYVRFVWGFGTDRRLNHHPVPAPGFDPAVWKGRTFSRDCEGSPFILRLERQVLCGLPEVRASVFLIRVYFMDGEEIRRDTEKRALLRSSLLSMTPESREYKGLVHCMDDVIAWLDEV